MKNVLIGIVGLVLVVGVVFGAVYLGVVNKDASLRAQAANMQEANKASFDTMWKIIQGKAEVSSEYRDSFKEIYKDIIAGRYASGGGSLIKFIKEANPNFDASLFRDVSRSIESERHRFLKDQKALLDVKREHDSLMTRWPSSWILAGRAPIEVTIVTSEETEGAFKTGKEAAPELFKKKEKPNGK